MIDKETEAYLAKIKKTVDEARAMVDTVKLRVAETDRLLAKQGLTREQVRAMRFSPEQEALVEEELKRCGLPPLVKDEELAALVEQTNMTQTALQTEPDETEAQTVENRRRKFGSMMQNFRL